jgi:Periplasmic binding protein-like domain
MTPAPVPGDCTALGVLSAAEAHGIQVPGDLSIVGFDGIRFAHTSGRATGSARLRYTRQGVSYRSSSRLMTIFSTARTSARARLKRWYRLSGVDFSSANHSG